MKSPSFDPVRAHTRCANNKTELTGARTCGCIYCLRIFSPGEIVEWWDEHEVTAVCPYCGIDAVIADTADFPVTKPFLKEMRQYWFTEAE
ncbi:MAG: cytoplasmic protein [Christensenella sp.]|nr:cytoplasmic protein [Christensenella sp.]